ncbi:protein phosphatase 1 regulatory subunit 1A-like [Diretmus argenteus]
MDSLLPAETEVMERETAKKTRRRIQFSVPSSIPTQLDPLQVEMIRRRRPTPATLFRMTDPPSPEEEGGPHQWVLGEHGALKAKRVNTSVYQPPTLKDVQRMAQAHLQPLGMCPCGSVEKEEPSSWEEGVEEESHRTASATGLPGESRAFRDQSALLDSSTGSAGHYSVSRRHRDEEEQAEEREEGKGE